MSLKRKLDQIPNLSGVYTFRDIKGEVIYIGKAKVLRNRVRSYFNKPDGKDPKTQVMVKNIADFDFSCFNGIIINKIGTGSKGEYFMNHPQNFSQVSRIGIGTKIIMVIFREIFLPDNLYPGVGLTGDTDIGKGLIILKKYIITGFMLFYEVGFGKERFYLRTHNQPF